MHTGTFVSYISAHLPTCAGTDILEKVNIEYPSWKEGTPKPSYLINLYFVLFYHTFPYFK